MIIPDMLNAPQADRVRVNLVTGSQPALPDPVNTQVILQQLVGSWTLPYQGSLANRSRSLETTMLSSDRTESLPLRSR